MDWAYIIDRNRTALLGVVAMLSAMLALTGDDAPVTLPRRLRNAILAILRPAESAARRLVVMKARGLVVTPAPATTTDTTSFTTSAVIRSGRPDGRSGRRKNHDNATPHAVPRNVSLPLLDHLIDPTRRPRRARFFPRICFPGLAEPAPLPKRPMPDDAVDATRLLGRLAALRRALDDLPAHARRFARLRARISARALPRRAVALRPGHPPGWRKRPSRAIDGILRDCHYFALEALEHDTG